MIQKIMLKKSQLVVNDLIDAFQDYSGVEHYFDKKDEQVTCITGISSDEESKLLKRIKRQPDRYIPIPQEDPKEAYHDMFDFIETLDDKNLKEKLHIAITGPGAFRRFKDVLLDYLDEREAWFSFKKDRTKTRACKWFERQGYSLSFK
jgi:hypothetical protein